MKEYSVLSNYKFGTKLYEAGIGSRYHWQNISNIVVGVASPFVAMLFPGTVVSLFYKNIDTVALMLVILVYALGIVLLNFVSQKCEVRTAGNYFRARLYTESPLYKHMLNMDYEKLVSKEGKELYGKAIDCVFSGSNIGIESFLKSFPGFIKYSIGFFIYAMIVLKASFIILIYLLASTMIYFGLTAIFEKRRANRNSSLEKLRIKQNKILAETLEDNAQADIMLYNAKSLMEKQFSTICQEQKREIKRYMRSYFYDGNIEGIITFIRDLMAYIYLISLVKKGEISTAQLIIYIGAVSGFSSWMKGSMKELVNMFVQNRYMSDYRRFLEFGAEINRNASVTRKGQAHKIEFCHVSYGYEGGKNVLNDVSFIINEGEKIALVGENGAGKTTIVKLLLGLLHPTSGKILMDGINIEDISREEYYSEFSAVFQEAFVLAESVGVNVSVEKGYDRDRVEKALSQAGLKDKIENLANGIDTELTKDLNEDGILLSGGETQKLMLARAIYNQAPMLVLDEPTAALDPLAESKMYESYSNLCDGKSSLFISHRLASTRFCDCIYLLENGRISESGTHDELLKAGKSYAKMFEIQAKYYTEEI